MTTRPLRRGRGRWRVPLTMAILLALASQSCDKGPALSRIEGVDENDVPDLGEVGAESPELGAVADVAIVYETPSKSSKPIGYLHAGARVRRSESNYETADCTTGWYRIAPRGYVCTEKSTTTDLEHPTLSAMALEARTDQPLPYTYAHTTKVTSLFERRDDQGVAQVGRLEKNAGMAIVGSWTAPDESHEPQRLGLMMNGSFVRAEDLRAAEPSEFHGVEIDKERELPVAFVVKRGVRWWALDASSAEKRDQLEYHEYLPLTGRYRTVHDEKFWAVEDGRWVRHRDVTAVRMRTNFPDFVKGNERWIDISIVMGTAVLYEGKKPVYATLVSVGRDRKGDPKITDSTAQGTFAIVSKHVTRRDKNPEEGDKMRDIPWAIELSSGQWMHAAYWHDRFGIEHTDGDIHWSPSDAARVWQFVSPELPSGWHAVRSSGDDAITRVVVR